MTTDIEWSDGLGSRSRRPFLLLIKGHEVHAFDGKNIPGVCVIKRDNYRKNGKWSHTEYTLALATGVRAISGKQGWECGTWIGGLASALGVAKFASWAELATAMQLPVEVVRPWLATWRPGAAKLLDDLEAALTSLG